MSADDSEIMNLLQISPSNRTVETLRDAFWEALLKEPRDRSVEDIETLVDNVQKLLLVKRAPETPYGKITSYRVETTDAKRNMKSETDVFETKATTSNLSLSTTYNISVRTINKPTYFDNYYGGAGEAVKNVVTTLPLAGQQVTYLKLPHIGTESVTVTWTAPKKPHGDIKSYHVAVMNRDTKEQQEIETTSNGIAFPNLTPHTFYKITVRTEIRQLNSNFGGLGEPVLIVFSTEPLSFMFFTHARGGSAIFASLSLDSAVYKVTSPAIR